MRYESLTEEEADLILHLSEGVLTCVSTGEFTEEAIEDVFVALMEAYDIEPEELEEAIEEFVAEDILDERKVVKKAKRKLRGAEDDPDDEPQDDDPGQPGYDKNKPPKSLGKLGPGMAVGKTPKKGGLMQMLKNALVGAVKKIYKQPDKAGEVLKRGASRLKRKAKKHLARKGMKMVFGKWLKTGDGKSEAPKKEPKEKTEAVAIIEEVQGILGEGSRSASVQAKRDFVRGAFERQGVVRMPRLDPKEYPPIRGLEGPFQFRSGRVLYYDPKKGRYYDSKSDMYLSRDEDPSRR